MLVSVLAFQEILKRLSTTLVPSFRSVKRTLEEKIGQETKKHGLS